MVFDKRDSRVAADSRNTCIPQCVLSHVGSQTSVYTVIQYVCKTNSSLSLDGWVSDRYKLAFQTA